MAQSGPAHRFSVHVVIQSVLAFILGLLVAGLAAILIAPALQRRTVRLTRKRLEATLPMSLNEIQAEKDRVRAEAAMQARRLEIEGRAHQAKANERAVELARLNERIKTFDLAASEGAAAISARDATIAELEGKLAFEREAMKASAAKLVEAETRSEKQQEAYDELSRRHDEATLVSSNRQVDLVSRDSDIERLNLAVSQLRAQRGDHEQKARDQFGTATRATEDLKHERRRVAELERRNERLLADLSDRDDRLERREKTIQALQDQVRGSSDEEVARLSAVPGSTEVTALRVALRAAEEERETLRVERDGLQERLAQANVLPAPVETDESAAAALDAQKAENQQLRRDLRRVERSEETLRLELTEMQAAAMQLEAEIADMAERNTKAEGEGSGAMDAALAKLEADRDRLEAQLLALAAENERLRQVTSSDEAAGGSVLPPNQSMLRDELAQVAAQMVHITRVLEGPNSPIEAALAVKPRGRRKSDKLTLADRIRALQASTSAPETT